MELTRSHKEAIPEDVRDRYDWLETRNAAHILRVTNPGAFEDIIDVLRDFVITQADMTQPGGQKSAVAARLDEAFREKGWREGRHDIEIALKLRLMPYVKAGEKKAKEVAGEVIRNEGYKADNVKDRVALDVEWNAKDGNLDRDLGAYRALYDAALIDVGVILTRAHWSIRDLSARLGGDKFSTTTTTNLHKLEPRLTRGDAGGCPLLAIAITDRCYDDEV